MSNHLERLSRETPYRRDAIERALKRAETLGATSDEAARAVELHAKSPWLSLEACVMLARSA